MDNNYRIKFNVLKQWLGEHELVLYGAGNFAKSLLEKFNKKMIAVDYCIVTRRKNNEDITIPVYEYAEKRNELECSNKYVLIAVTEPYESEIENILQDIPNIKYAFAHNFIKENVPASIDFNKINNKNYKEQICEWYADEFNIKTALFSIKTLEKHIQKKRKNDSVLFIILDLSPRVVKIAGALKANGYQVNIICAPTAYIREVCIDELSNLKLSVRYCECMEEMMYYIIDSDAFLCHLFSCAERSIIAQILIMNQNLFPPIIYDEYDVINGFHLGKKEEYYQAERYCLENAIAVCNRGYEYEFLLNNLNFSLTNKWLQFSDFCRNDKFLTIAPVSKDKPLSVCFVGLVKPVIFGEYYQTFIEFGEICKYNNCHVHIYPTLKDNTYYKDLVAYSEMNDHFHIHNPLPYNELALEISQYDYGFLPIKFGYEKVKNHGVVNNYHFIYGTSNKLFDYLDAGLPIISPFHKKAIEVLSKENVVFPWTIEEIDFKILLENRNLMKNNVKKARVKFSIMHNIKKLINFYNSVAEKGEV